MDLDDDVDRAALALVRTDALGDDGPALTGAHSTLIHAGNLLAPAVAGFANAPGWLAAWMQPHLDAIVTAPANYALDTAGELGRWIVLRELLAELRTLLSTPGNAGVTPDGRRARRLYQVIEAERANYAAAGLASAQYTFLGHTYQLQNQGANHYYASRNGHNIEYGADFTRKDALDVLKHFVQTPNVPYAHATDVDNFICAFFAEPTRWPEEQVLNTLAIMRKGADADSCC